MSKLFGKIANSTKEKIPDRMAEDMCYKYFD